MNKAMRGTVGLLLCLGGTPLVSANDSTAALGAGGLVFTKTDAIAMEQEDLFISEDKLSLQTFFQLKGCRDSCNVCRNCY